MAIIFPFKLEYSIERNTLQLSRRQMWAQIIIKKLIALTGNWTPISISPPWWNALSHFFDIMCKVLVFLMQGGDFFLFSRLCQILVCSDSTWHFHDDDGGGSCMRNFLRVEVWDVNPVDFLNQRANTAAAGPATQQPQERELIYLLHLWSVVNQHNNQSSSSYIQWNIIAYSVSSINNTFKNTHT